MNSHTTVSSPIERIGHHIIFEILSYLEPKDLHNFMRVNKNISQLMHETKAHNIIVATTIESLKKALIDSPTNYIILFENKSTEDKKSNEQAINTTTQTNTTTPNSTLQGFYKFVKSIIGRSNNQLPADNNKSQDIEKTNPLERGTYADVLKAYQHNAVYQSLSDSLNTVRTIKKTGISLLTLGLADCLAAMALSSGIYDHCPPVYYNATERLFNSTTKESYNVTYTYIDHHNCPPDTQWLFGPILGSMLPAGAITIAIGSLCIFRTRHKREDAQAKVLRDYNVNKLNCNLFFIANLNKRNNLSIDNLETVVANKINFLSMLNRYSKYA